MEKFNKPKYIRKYDYLKSFYSPQNHWFWSTQEIQTQLDQLILQEYKKQNVVDEQNIILDDEDEEQNNDLFYEEYKHQIQTKQDLNLNDPKAIEGKFIDKKSQEFIIKSFANYHCQIIDFTQKYKNLTLEQQYAKTIELLKKNQNIILFQPVFIAKNKVIDLPDSIIKINDEIQLIETKASTCPKGFHTMDLIYQANVINFILEQHKLKPISKFFLCLIDKDCKSQKKDVAFILTSQLSSNISGRKNFKNDGKNIDFFTISSSNERKNHNYQLEIKNFWQKIDELFTWKKTSSLDFAPRKEFKSFFNKNIIWKSLNEYYRISNKYSFMGFSGHLIKFELSISLYNEKSKINPNDIFANFDYFYPKIKETKIIRNFKSLENEAKKYGNFKYFIPQATIESLKNLKSKKVYFDFETINLCLAPFDQCQAYRQIVTQVSIITVNNQQEISNCLCRNYINDPKKINQKWFKEIVDALLLGIDNPNEYSFIVYNKSFEESRLKEMIGYINDPIYTKKINSIIANIFDLADYFNLREKTACAIWENKGFYSIKYVLNFILKNWPKYYQTLKIKNYKTLDIQNGKQAQDKTILRFFGLIDDQEWIKIEQQLKKYCENDVRAMIVLEYWLKNN